MWKKYALIFLIMQAAQPVWGQSKKHPLDVKLDRCLTTNPGTTSERFCINDINTEWDKRLNQIYAALGGSRNTALFRSQLAWLAFRDAEYTYIEKHFAYDGTMYLLMKSDAKMQVVRRRVLDLEAHLAFQKEHQ